MKHPDFKHRSMPDGGDYSEFLPIDLLAVLSSKIDVIVDEINLVGDEFNIPANERRSDQTNANVLDEARNNVLDLRVMFEWFLANHEIVKVEEYHPEDYEEDKPVEALNTTMLN